MLPTSLFKTDLVPQEVRFHLVRVYTVLAITLLFATIGIYVQLTYHFGGGIISWVSCLGLLFAIKLGGFQEREQTVMLGLFGFFKGTAIGPLVSVSLYIDPSLVVMAFLSTCIVFISFSLVAMTQSRRDVMYVIGLINPN